MGSGVENSGGLGLGAIAPPVPAIFVRVRVRVVEKFIFQPLPEKRARVRLGGGQSTGFEQDRNIGPIETRHASLKSWREIRPL